MKLPKYYILCLVSNIIYNIMINIEIVNVILYVANTQVIYLLLPILWENIIEQVKQIKTMLVLIHNIIHLQVPNI